MIRKRFAFDKFHDQKRLALVFFDTMDGRNIGMVERRQQLSFAFKASQPLTFMDQRFRYELQRYGTIEFDILGEIDLPHCAFADLFSDLVMGDGSADQKGPRFPAFDLP
jgi:hypothetical protein